MNLLLLVAIAFLAAFLGSIIAFMVVQKRNNAGEDDAQFEDKFARISNGIFQNNTEQFMTLAKEVLGSQKNEIKTDLDGKKSAIAELITEIRKDLQKNEERLIQSDNDRVRSFSSLEQELKSYKEITGELKMSTDKLKNLLSDNQPCRCRRMIICYQKTTPVTQK